MGSRLLRALLLAYPPSLRRSHGAEMLAAANDRWRDCRTLMSRLKFLADIPSDAAASWRRPRAPRLNGLPSDVRDVTRLFRRSPMFSLAAVITLALGIGATTAVLSLADATLLRPLPLPHADRVLQSTFSFSYPDFRELAAEHRGFSNVAAVTNNAFALERNGDVVQVSGNGVSGAFFTLTNQHPIAGRLLDASDDVIGAPLTAVISERLWERVYQRDPSIVGASVNVNQRRATIVGITPASFRGLSLQSAPELFVGIVNIPDLAGGGFFSGGGFSTNRGRVWLNLVGRLADGVEAPAANEEARRIYYNHRSAEKQDTSLWFAPITSIALGARTSADLRRFIAVLIGAASVTLLLTCATVANLLLVRSDRRSRELAVRSALGAGRARLARLLLIESLAIGLTGGVLGALVARASLSVLGSFALPGQIVIDDLRLTLNLQMLAAGVALGLLTSLVVGMAPVWQMRRLGFSAALGAGARATSRHTVKSVLVAAQVALSILLLGGSIAFGRAIQYALTLDLGFNTANTSITAINPTLARYTRARSSELRTRTLDQLRAHPQVAAAGWDMIRPMSGGFIIEPVVDGYESPKGSPTSVQANVVSGAYFDAMQIPVIKGRAFGDMDSAANAESLIISASLAERYWPGKDPIGKRIRVNEQADAKSLGAEVVGVVGDIHRAVGGPAVPMIYMSATQAPPGFAPDYLIVRSTSAPSLLLNDIRSTLRGIDPAVPITSAMPMTRHVEGPLMAHRLGLTLFAMFAGVAMLLTGFGLYAVVASAVAQRTREIGLRVALGAESSSVIRLVARQGFIPVVAGLAAGVAVFVWSATLISTFMFTLPAVTPLTIVVIAGAVAAIALLATVGPVRRALSIDPTIALRAE